MAGDHYLQAGLLGRWGKPSAKGMRSWKVQAKMKRSGEVCEMSPEGLGKVNGLTDATFRIIPLIEAGPTPTGHSEKPGAGAPRVEGCQR